MRAFIISLSICCFIILSSSASKAQKPSVVWENCVPSPAFPNIASEEARAIVETSDGGYLMLGTTGLINGGIVQTNPSTTDGGVDFWFVKFNSQGQVLWQKGMGSSNDEKGYDLIRTSDGGYAACGYTWWDSVKQSGQVSGAHGGVDMWVIKLDSEVNIQWQKCIGTPRTENANQIIQTSDGGYAVCGGLNNKIGLVKLDAAGNTQWQFTDSSTNQQRAASVCELPQGGFVVVGVIKGSAIDDGWGTGDSVDDGVAIKVTSTGLAVWKHVFAGSSRDIAESVVSTTDGGCVIAGITASKDGDFSDNAKFPTFGGAGWVCQLDSSGSSRWLHNYGTIWGGSAFTIIHTQDNGYAFAGLGIKEPPEGQQKPLNGVDYWIVKIDSIGKMQWQDYYGGTGREEAYSIMQSRSGAYVLAGYTKSRDGDVSGYHGFQNAWIVKLGAENGVEANRRVGYHQRIYPNPATSVLNIASIEASTPYRVVDMMGRIVNSGMVGNNTDIAIDVSHFPPGVYFVLVDDLRDGHPVLVGKALIEGR